MKKLEKFADREISSEAQRKIKVGIQCCIDFAESYCSYSKYDYYYYKDCCDTVLWACNYIPSAFGC